MTKYSQEARIKAAKEYCRGGRGLREVAGRHGVNVASLRLWVATYRIHGARGLRRNTRMIYSAEFKLAVLDRMRNENLSRRQAAALFNVKRHDMIGIWQRAYDSGGVAALHSAADRRRETTMEELTCREIFGPVDS
jgi:transposase